MSKNRSLTLDEEQDERAQYAGMLKAEIQVAATSIGEAKEKAAKISGDLSAKLENFEDKGGHKKALKWAKTVADMEPAIAQDFLRCFMGYCDALGVNDQIDMFVQQMENDRNADSIAIASSGPSYGSEPVH